MSREIDNEFRQRTFRLLEAFVYDYLRKSGCIETARTYFEEAQLDDWPPPWLEQLVASPISPVAVPPSIATTQQSREESFDYSDQTCTREFTDELGGSFDENMHNDGSFEDASNIDSILDPKVQLIQVKEEDERLKIKTESVNDSILPSEFSHETIINSHVSGSDYLQYAERSPSIISATTTHEELPDLLLPLEGQDDFLQDWWSIVWENYKTMFERQTGIVLPTDF